MKKLNKGHVILALIVIIIIAIFWLVKCQPIPPLPPTSTPTKTKVTPTSTFTPTKTEPIPTKTEIVEPTLTPTLEPTKTPTPKPTEFMLMVHTGYENGWLHFRPGPSKIFLPNWVNGIGAFKENTVLNFLDCPPVTYSWVHIMYETYSGYVYGEYLNKNPCTK